MRRYGIRISKVSLLGLPFRWLPHWRRRRGETEWIFSPLLPVAAFVKPAEEDAADALPLWKQAHIYSNGITANLAFTVAAFGFGLSAHVAELPEATIAGTLLPSAIGLAAAWIVWLAQRYVPALLIAAMPALAFVILRDVFSASPGEAVDRGAGGPVAIGSLFGKARDLKDVFIIPAIVSLNLAAVNLLPIPPLDGGQILVATLRKFAGKRTADAVLVVGALGAVALIVYSLTLDGIRVFRWLTD